MSGRGRPGADVHWTAGALASGPWSVALTREAADWRWTSLRILELDPDASEALVSGEEELLVLPLSGACAVACDGEVVDLAGRRNVFAAPSDFAYVPRDAELVVSSASGGRFALTGALARRRLPFRRHAISESAVELRGAGNCSRRVVNYCMGDTVEADRLLVCEVVTPSGNWSSYPPHKHDEQRDGETELEEIYYFEVEEGPAGPGAAYMRVYGSDAGPIDFAGTVGHGDVVAVPHGFHGPAMAPPGFDLYYLNVMAGPERSWQASDDPTYGWVRGTWEDQPVDARFAARWPDTGAPARGAGV